MTARGRDLATPVRCAPRRSSSCCRARPGRPGDDRRPSSRRYEQDVGPMNGAKVVARAWTDPDYRGPAARRRDRRDRRARLQGSAGRAHRGRGEHRRPCTTSSSAPCAPAIRGPCSGCRRPGTRIPPTGPGWCESRAQRAARDGAGPRTTTSSIRVWDSSSEVRYMVLPERPAGHRGLTEEELAALRDPRRHGRRRRQVAAVVSDQQVPDRGYDRLDGPAAPPRGNGELVLRGALGEPGVRRWRSR